MRKKKPKIIDITNMSEEAIIHAFDVENKAHIKRMKIRLTVASFGLLLLVWGMLTFSFVTLPGMVKSWFGA